MIAEFFSGPTSGLKADFGLQHEAAVNALAEGHFSNTEILGKISETGCLPGQ